MTPNAVFLLQAFVIVAVPVVLLRMSGLKGVMPLVVVQIIVGVALGPSVFGRIYPDYFQMLAGPSALLPLSGLASVAVLIFALISGLHVDPAIFAGKERVFWPVAAGSIVAPMALGCLGGWWILARFPEELLPGITRAEFLAAIGICVSMNALPVLAAILGEMGLLGSRVSKIALGVAGINNMVLWVCLGLLLTAHAAGGSQASHKLVPPIYLLALAPIYLVIMLQVARPVLSQMVSIRMCDNLINPRALVVLGAATIASALATEFMGLHFIIGAFLVGAIIPPTLHKPIIDRIHVMTVALLMPFFFTLTGMRILIDVDYGPLIEMFAVFAGVGVAGIVYGTAVAARWAGEEWSVALGLGSLLQSKGLTELIVLTILLDARIVSPRVFTAMILVALFSATIAMPLARLALARSGARGLVGQPLTAPGPPI
jgi:Kef-type K+ transport system membrane component KefB